MSEYARLHIFIYLDTEHAGPFRLPQIKQMFDEGRIDRSTLIWYEGLTSWIALGDIPGFDRRVKVEVSRPEHVVPADHYLITVRAVQTLVKKADIKGKIAANEVRRGDFIYDTFKNQWVRLDHHPETRVHYDPPPLPKMGLFRKLFGK